MLPPRFPRGLAALDGPLYLFRTARSLFYHSYVDHDFLSVSVMVGYQAVEAAFRNLNPRPEKAKFHRLTEPARADGYLSEDRAKWVSDLREMRNQLSHPFISPYSDLSLMANMLEFPHQTVAVIMAAANRHTRRAGMPTALEWTRGDG